MKPNAARARLPEALTGRRDGEGFVAGPERGGRPHAARGAKMAAGKADSGKSEFSTDLTRIDELPVPSERALKFVYDLTPAEARLAQGISRGGSLEEVAADLGIRISTARTQLASIFAKTDTRRQARLVAILSHLAHLER